MGSFLEGLFEFFIDWFPYSGDDDLIEGEPKSEKGNWIGWMFMAVGCLLVLTAIAAIVYSIIKHKS